MDNNPAISTVTSSGTVTKLFKSIATLIYSPPYDQASFAPVARLVWLREETINEQVSEQDKDWLAKFNDKERETRVNLREIPSFYDDYVKKDKLDDILGIKVYYYHNDQLGTPNELTNDKGEVVWLADYEAWGRIAKEKYDTQCIGDFEISPNEFQPIRFQGQSFDAETGLHYNRFRYYDPDVGMFISRDPIGLMGGDNVFAYAPNPTGWIDPLGLNNYGMGMFQDYGNSPGMKWAIHDAKNQYEDIQNGKVSTSKPPFYANTTVMKNVSIAGQLGIGGDITFGSGKSYDENGIPSQCYSTTVCAATGVAAMASGSFTGSVTNASTPKGFGRTTQLCTEGGAAAVVGATGSACVGSDGSTTGSAGVAFGGGGRVSPKACQAFSYCR